MNDFVNPQHRGVNLPPGFKDLMDVLEAKNAGWVEPWKAQPVVKPAPGQTLADVEKYVRHLFESRSKSASLLFMPLDPKNRFRFSVGKDLPMALFRFVEDGTPCETSVRQIFTERNISPIADSVVAGSRILMYWVPNSLPEISSLAMDLLRRAYGISETGELQIHFHEK